LVGGLLWVAGAVRPDIAVDASALSGVVRKATVADAHKANKILSYLKDTANIGLRFQHISGDQRLLGYADAAFQNLNEGQSMGGHMIMICPRQ